MVIFMYMSYSTQVLCIKIWRIRRNKIKFVLLFFTVNSCYTIFVTEFIYWRKRAGVQYSYCTSSGRSTELFNYSAGESYVETSKYTLWDTLQECLITLNEILCRYIWLYFQKLCGHIWFHFMGWLAWTSYYT